MRTPELSLVMPAYNEAAHLRTHVLGIVKTLEKKNIDYEILVVDNGSRDDTARVLADLKDENVRIIPVTLSQNAGYGGGILVGLAKARGNILGWIDADGQQAPEAIVRVFESLRAGNAGFAKGVRVIRQENRFRRIQSMFFNMLFRLLFGSYATDVNAKPKLMRRNAYERMDLTYQDWFIDAELVIQMKRNSIPIIEIPIEWHRRKEGRSNVRLLTVIEFLWNMLLYRLGLR